MPLDGRHAVTLRDTYGAKGLGMKIVGGITLMSLALDEARYQVKTMCSDTRFPF